MMKNLMKLLLYMLIAGITISCGGENSSAVSKNKYLGNIVAIQQNRAQREAQKEKEFESLTEKSDVEKARKRFLEYEETEKADLEKLEKESESLKGTEIPTEAAGLPVRVSKPATITGVAYGGFPSGEIELETTEDVSLQSLSDATSYKMRISFLDEDGNAIDTKSTICLFGKCGGFGDFQSETIAKGTKKSLTFEIRVREEDAEKWAKFAKIVVERDAK